MERLVCHFHCFLNKLAGVEIVVEWAASDLRQLTIMAVREDREILPTWGEVRR